mmetsp:Transcript_52101/g.58248  ORF Transcript_52101/g.58248 Transcript_52101/m.58248 type:complete len:139 (-) Transcript_52101:1586-2002(-)
MEDVLAGGDGNVATILCTTGRYTFDFLPSQYNSRVRSIDVIVDLLMLGEQISIQPLTTRIGSILIFRDGAYISVSLHPSMSSQPSQSVPVLFLSHILSQRVPNYTYVCCYYLLQTGTVETERRGTVMSFSPSSRGEYS